VTRSDFAGHPAFLQILRVGRSPRAAAHRAFVFGRSFALSAHPRVLSLSSSKKEERVGERRRFYQVPLSPTLSPLVPRREREAKHHKRFTGRTQLLTEPHSENRRVLRRFRQILIDCNSSLRCAANRYELPVLSDHFFSSAFTWMEIGTE